MGIFDNQPDEINGSNGIYRLWLSKDSRTPFHETIQAILEILFPDESTETNSEYTHTSSFSNKSDERREPPIRDPISCDPKGKLFKIFYYDSFSQTITKIENDKTIIIF